MTLAVIAALGAMIGAVRLYSQSSGGGAEYIGSAQCLACHENIDTQLMATKHSILFQKEGPEDKQGCEACHGPGSEHMSEAPEGIIRFNGASKAAESAACLKCHADGDKAEWKMSIHASEDMSCADCHSPHGKVKERSEREKREIETLLVDSEADLCLDCHQEKRGEFSKPSHMPVLEGQMGCSDCHSPHNNSPLQMERAAASCVSCHAEKSGPFLTEHEPVAESCLNCHDPHGSVNQNLLTQRQPTLCLQCHANTSVIHRSNSTQYKTCTNCHKAVHGSRLNADNNLFN